MCTVKCGSCEEGCFPNQRSPAHRQFCNCGQTHCKTMVKWRKTRRQICDIILVAKAISNCITPRALLRPFANRANLLSCFVRMAQNLSVTCPNATVFRVYEEKGTIRFSNLTLLLASLLLLFLFPLSLPCVYCCNRFCCCCRRTASEMIRKQYHQLVTPEKPSKFMIKARDG